MSEVEMRAAVERGAQLLDEKKPGWEEKIQQPLSLMCCHNCILGQLFYAWYSDGLRALGLDGSNCVEYGFNAKYYEDYFPLKDLWLEQIEWRLQCKAK